MHQMQKNNEFDVNCEWAVNYGESRKGIVIEAPF